MQWALLPFRKYSEFNGRSRRKEFWLFCLLMVVVYLIADVLDRTIGMAGSVAGVYGPFSILTLLVLLTPQLSVMVRRLHDTGRSGWWVLVGFLSPIGVVLMTVTSSPAFMLLGLGSLILVYFWVLDGTRGPNAYGVDPKGVEEAIAPVA